MWKYLSGSIPYSKNERYDSILLPPVFCFGYRRDSTSIIGYVPLLLDERDYGRRVGGSDVAKGSGLRLRVSGNEIKTLETRLSLFNKGPVYKDFLYYIVGPEVIWQDDENWKEEYVLKFGFEMLLWGDDPIK